MIEFLKMHMVEIAIATGVVINILNAITRHFKDHHILVRWISVIIDVLSFIPSKTSLKLPGTVTKRPE